MGARQLATATPVVKFLPCKCTADARSVGGRGDTADEHTCMTRRSLLDPEHLENSCSPRQGGSTTSVAALGPRCVHDVRVGSYFISKQQGGRSCPVLVGFGVAKWISSLTGFLRASA